jgi:TP901 family phage tail tape measure protein
MADMQTNINVNIDVSDALANLKNLQREISAVQSSLARGSAAQVSAARNLQQELVNSINATGKFSATFKKVETTSEAFTRSLEKNKLSLSEYFRYAGGASKKFGSMFSAEMATIDKVARERVKTLQTQYIKLGRDANGAMQSIAIRPLVLDMDNLATRTAMAAQKQQILNQLLKQGSTNLLNFGKNTQWAGRQLMVGFTIPLSILGTTAAKNFMELETQAIKFKKVYGDLFTAPVERQEALAAIQELGKEFTQYGVSISDTIGLAAEAAAAGFQGVDLQRQTTEATRLSILGQLDQQKALETTISLQNAFRMSSEDLADSINFLNAVENQTVVSLDDITTAIPKVAPVIQQLGGDVKDLTFFLAAMKEGGINASEGANALKSGLASLINPTEKASQMLGAFGINIRGIVQQNAGDLKQTVIDFALALDQLDPLQRAQAIEQLFGKFQFARLSTLFDNVIRDGNQASRVLELAAASSSELADSANQELGVSAASAMNQFKKAVEELQFALAPIGEIFLKAVTPLINFATDVLQNFNKMDAGVKTFVINMIGLIGGIGPIALMTFGLLANGVANIIKMFLGLRNIFGKNKDATQALGEGTDYLTQQQLEAAAVAASLDQAHMKLTQRFTSEKTAVDQLTTAYQKMVAAQTARFPNVAAGAKPKKMATGGTVPGTGSGDTVPAMLTPGEFVVNKDAAQKAMPFLQALNSGNLPGFEFGGLVGKSSPATKETYSQYNNVFAHLTEPIATSLENFAKRLADLGVKIPADIQRKLEAGLGKATVRAYGGLGFETRQSYNDAMKAGRAGVVPEDFLEDFKSRGLEKWQQSLKVAGVKLDDVSADLSILDKSLIDQIEAARKADAKFTVTDKAMGEFVENALKPLRAKGSALADAFDRAKNIVTEVRGNTTQAIANAAGYTPDPERKGYYINQSLDPNDKNYRIKTSRLIKIGGGAKGKTTGGVLGGTTMQQIQGTFNDEAATTAQTNSESKRTRKIAKDTVNGYVNELERGKKRAAAAGAATANASVAATTQASRYRDPATGRFARRPEEPTTPAPGAIAVGANNASRELDTFSSKISKVSFGLSAVSGILTIFGGQVGEISGIIFAVSSAMWGLITVTELLAKTKLAEIATGRANMVANKITQGATAASLFTKGGGIAGLFSNLGKGLQFVLRFLGPVGIGLSILAIAVPLVVNLMEEQKKKLLGLSVVSGMAAEKIKKFGDVVGAETPKSPFGVATVLPKPGEIGLTAERTVSAQQAIEDFGGIDTFKAEYATEIEALSNGTADSIEATLSALAIRLFGAGWAEDQVRAMIDALQIAAGGVKVDLNLASLNFMTDSKFDVNIIKQQAEEQARVYQEAYSAEAARLKGVGTEIPEEGVALPDSTIAKNITDIEAYIQKQKQSIALASQGKSEQEVKTDPMIQQMIYDLQQAENSLAFFTQNVAVTSDTVKTKMNEAMTNAAAVIDGLGTAFYNGDISLQEFRSGLDAALFPLDSIQDKLAATDVLMKALGFDPLLLSEITDIDARLAMIDAKAAGIDLSTFINEYLSADTDAERIKLVEDLIDKTKQLTEEKEYQNELDAQQEEYNAVMEEANGYIGDQIETLEYQNQAYQILIDNGWSAADALEAVGNASVAQALAMASGAGERAQIIADLERLKQLQTSSPVAVARRTVSGGGGGGRKSDYQQAIDKLKEERREIANNFVAYNRLRDAGFDIADAFNAAKDPVLATALATTKVGTAAWEKLVSLIQQTNAELAQSEIFNLLQEQQMEIELGASFLNIAPTLAGMGLAYDEMQTILNNPALAAAFVSDLQDGVLDAQELVTYLQQIEAMKQIEINLRLSTEEGVQDQFRELYGMAMDMVDTYERQVEDDFEDVIRNIEKQMKDAQKVVADLQEEVADRQREIELSFTRPITALQEESSDLANDLAIIDNLTADINKRYDEQQKALEQVAKVNEKLIAQDQARLTIADALTQGNIADAAKAIQDLRAQEAQGQVGTQQDLLNAARQSEIDALRSESGMTREEIAKRQFEISQEIYKLEEQREIKLREIQEIEDEIYNIQENTLEVLQDELDLQNELKDAELEKIRLQREAWEDALLAADQARINSEEYQKVLEMTAFLMEGMQKTWDEIKSKTIELYIREIRIPEGAPAPPATGGGTGGGGNGTDTPVVTPPPYYLDPNKYSLFGSRISKMQNMAYSLFIANQIASKYSSFQTALRNYQNAATPSDAATLKPKVKAAYDALDGGLKAGGFASGGIIPSYMRMGGMLPYKAEGGMFKSRGSDTVPAMLTPGEYVIRRPMVRKFGKEFFDNLNNGTFKPIFNKPGFNMPSYGLPNSNSSFGKLEKQIMQIQDSVYNYSVNVNVQTDANPDQIARAVMSQINRVDSMRIRGNRF